MFTVLRAGFAVAFWGGTVAIIAGLVWLSVQKPPADWVNPLSMEGQGYSAEVRALIGE